MDHRRVSASGKQMLEDWTSNVGDKIVNNFEIVDILIFSDDLKKFRNFSRFRFKNNSKLNIFKHWFRDQIHVINML